MQVVSRGMRNRKVGSHEMNMESSRSHSIVTVHCDTPAGDDNDNCARYGKVRLPGGTHPEQTSTSGAALAVPGGARTLPAACSLAHPALLELGDPAVGRGGAGPPACCAAMQPEAGHQGPAAVNVRCPTIPRPPAHTRPVQVSFVDLAGSERVKDTKASGEMLKETSSINRSLFTLGKARPLRRPSRSAALAARRLAAPARAAAMYCDAPAPEHAAAGHLPAGPRMAPSESFPRATCQLISQLQPCMGACAHHHHARPRACLPVCGLRSRALHMLRLRAGLVDAQPGAAEQCMLGWQSSHEHAVRTGAGSAGDWQHRNHGSVSSVCLKR